MMEIRERVFFWMDKIEVFGKALNKPKGLSGSSAPIPEPFGGIPSGVFAVFAVVILTLALADDLIVTCGSSFSRVAIGLSRRPATVVSGSKKGGGLGEAI